VFDKVEAEQAPAEGGDGQAPAAAPAAPEQAPAQV
jgi:hypothetical protein